MATKAKKPAKIEKKAAKAPAKAAGKMSGKAAKLAAKAAEEAVVVHPSADEREEAEEQAEEAAASSGGGGNAAALAAASGPGEMSASFKNFRHHPDMENFYRFIYDNDLRHEALHILDEMMVDKQAKKAMKGAKAHAH